LFFTAKPLLTEKQTKHPVMILTKDQTFLERFGREPDRLDFALIINLLNKADTKVAAFDFIFDQPTEHPEKDQAFSNALKTFPFPLAAEHFLTRGKQTFEQLNLIDANYNRPPWPLPLFKQISDNIDAKGLINLVSDFDSTVRYVPLAFLPTEMKEFRPSLGYATWVSEIFATSFDKAFLTADQTTNLTAEEIIIKTLSKGPYKFKTTGHIGIDLMIGRSNGFII
jgi:CHASE2 domain-containing sensor protein